MYVLTNEFLSPNHLKTLDDIRRNEDIVNDMISSLCGEKIGSGQFRDVFHYKLDDRYVIKLERGETRGNVTEELLWYEVQGLKGELAWVKKWFASINWVSPNGKILVMEKTEIRKGKKRPDKVPYFFMDVKYDNFGWIGNRFVCHDYGFLNKFIKYSKKKQKVVWYD